MDSRKLRIICVNGGKTYGNTAIMLGDIGTGCHRFTEEHPQLKPLAMNIHYWPLAEPAFDIPLLIDPSRQKPKGVVASLLRSLSEADGLIYATPVHYNNASALMLRLLAWSYYMEEEEGWPLEGMPVGYAAQGHIDGCQSAINAMQNVLMHTKCTTVQDGHYYRMASLMPFAAEDPELKWMATDAPLLGLRVAEAAYRIKYQV